MEDEIGKEITPSSFCCDDSRVKFSIGDLR
jgi:hypothetical protein